MAKDFKNTLPSELVRNAIALCASRGEPWLNSLPGIIEQLEQTWSIRAGKHFSNLSYNYVSRATTADGEEVVFKIAIPVADPEIRGEAEYLRLLNGAGCVRLLNEDKELNAILIELVRPGENLKSLFHASGVDVVSVAVNLIRRSLRKPPEDTSSLIILDDWFDGLRRAEGTAFPGEYAVKALEYYAQLSSDSSNIFLLHGDLHHENILSATREPYLLIDPKGIVGHFGYDIGVFLNNHHWLIEDEPDVATGLDRVVSGFSAAFDLEESVIRKWAYCQMVLSWWWTFDEVAGTKLDDLGLSDIWQV